MNLSGISCIIIALICVFASRNFQWVDPFPSETKMHAIMGLTCVIIAFLQPFGALLRCHPGKKYRWVFNVFHGCLGISGLVIASKYCAIIRYSVVKYRFSTSVAQYLTFSISTVQYHTFTIKYTKVRYSYNKFSTVTYRCNKYNLVQYQTVPISTAQ